MLVGKISTTSKRWPRGQKFVLSLEGAAAEEAYRAAVLGARASGRAALDSALAAWAAPRGVDAADGVILAELSGKRLGLAALCERLESAGVAAADVRGGRIHVDLLQHAALVQDVDARDGRGRDGVDVHVQRAGLRRVHRQLRARLLAIDRHKQ